jgi:hypothetical protein
MNLWYLFLAYSLIWLCLVYLLFRMAYKLSYLQKKLKDLHEPEE